MKIKRFISRYISWDRYFSSADFSSYSLEVLEFRKVRLSDRSELSYNAWSRIFEYPLIIDKINEFGPGRDISIHNSSWGFDDCHIDFKNVLEEQYGEIVNSDLLPSTVPNTVEWDITSTPPTEYSNRFDVVINVSTVEEVDADHLLIIDNLLQQIKPDGLLILTFDIPGMQMGKLEKLVGQSISTSPEDLNGANSPIPHAKYRNLTCGLLVLRKRAAAVTA